MSKLKQLQNNYTTPEQSKRLLELGLPADSADCYLQRGENEDDGIVDYKPFIGKSPAIEGNLFSYRYGYTIPCWSVGRLREIFCICSSVNGTREYPFCNDQVAWWITEFEFKKEFIDFSKLED